MEIDWVCTDLTRSNNTNGHQCPWVIVEERAVYLLWYVLMGMLGLDHCFLHGILEGTTPGQGTHPCAVARPVLRIAFRPRVAGWDWGWGANTRLSTRTRTTHFRGLSSWRSFTRSARTPTSGLYARSGNRAHSRKWSWQTGVRKCVSPRKRQPRTRQLLSRMHAERS